MSKIKKKRHDLIIYLIEILYPFILMFGIYVIVYGHKSPGGGFQGGAILASVFILEYIVKSVTESQISKFKKLEEIIYIYVLIIASISVLTKGHLFTNFLSNYPEYSKYYLILMNLIIGFKVCFGLTVIFYEFVIHEKRWGENLDQID